MAGSLSNYAEDMLLDHLLSKTAFTMPANVYLALCTVTITDSMTGATITEANYTGYARKELLASDIPASSGGSVSNTTAVTFPACTAGSSTIVGVALLDSGTIGAGNMLCYSDVTSHVIDASNTPPTFAIGALVWTLV